MEIPILQSTIEIDEPLVEEPPVEIRTQVREYERGDRRAFDLETSPIAVGQACGRNPVPVIVPCHRVVGSDGSLNGYSAADGVETKRRLLELETPEQDTVQTRLATDT